MNTVPKSLDSLSCSSTPPTAALVLANGMVLKGFGCGAQGEAIAELCFNTAMTGYQEILTDPSYKDQIVLFTFPHIGNVGCNDEDEEAANPRARIAARGVVMRERPTPASSWRATDRLDQWLNARGIIGISGVDTRALTNYIRQNGMQNAVIAHNADGEFDIEALTQKARGWTGLVGLDLASSVDTEIRHPWRQTRWHWSEGFGELLNPAKHVVVIDYGVKRNILRCLATAKIDVTIVPATTSAAAILALEPDGIVLSNGPGDPQATGEYSLPVIRALVRSGKPVFGICLGHQMLALAMGAQTVKMDQGHHGANHPVQDLTTGKVEIVSMNHGFAVDSQTLPEGVTETHRSLFDGSNCGIRVEDKPVFSVQHHPEASPGPHDSAYVFSQFAASL